VEIACARSLAETIQPSDRKVYVEGTNKRKGKRYIKLHYQERNRTGLRDRDTVYWSRQCSSEKSNRGKIKGMRP